MCECSYWAERKAKERRDRSDGFSSYHKHHDIYNTEKIIIIKPSKRWEPPRQVEAYYDADDEEYQNERYDLPTTAGCLKKASSSFNGRKKIRDEDENDDDYTDYDDDESCSRMEGEGVRYDDGSMVGHGQDTVLTEDERPHGTTATTVSSSYVNEDDDDDMFSDQFTCTPSFIHEEDDHHIIMSEDDFPFHPHHDNAGIEIINEELSKSSLFAEEEEDDDDDDLSVSAGEDREQYYEDDREQEHTGAYGTATKTVFSVSQDSSNTSTSATSATTTTTSTTTTTAIVESHLIANSTLVQPLLNEQIRFSPLPEVQFESDRGEQEGRSTLVSIIKPFQANRIPIYNHDDVWQQLPRPNLREIRERQHEQQHSRSHRSMTRVIATATAMATTVTSTSRGTAQRPERQPPLTYRQFQLQMQQRHVVVRFGDVLIRSYEQTVGDNPAVSDGGVPIALGWVYQQMDPVDVERYERLRPSEWRRKGLCNLTMPAAERKRRLVETWGVSLRTIRTATRRTRLIQRQRRRTNCWLLWNHVEDACHSASRKCKRQWNTMLTASTSMMTISTTTTTGRTQRTGPANPMRWRC